MNNKDEQKQIIRIIDDEEKKLKYSNFQTFVKYYIKNKGDFLKTAEQLNVDPEYIVKEIFKDSKKRKLFSEAKKIILTLQAEELERQLIKTAKIKEQLGMFFLKTAFPEIYGEKSKRPLTIKFQSKIRGKTIDIPDLEQNE